MNVCLNFLLFIVIFNPSNIIAKRVKDIEGKFNISNNNKKQIFRPSNITTLKTTPKLSGKWQVGRVSRKQYEIINMLWKKTKIFIEREEMQSTTTSDKSLKVTNKRIRDKIGKHMTLVDHNPIQESFQIAHPKTIFYSSTPSYIEFYYLDELGDRIRYRDTDIKHKKNVVTKSRITDKSSTAGLPRSRLFLFRVNDATCKATTLHPFTNHFVKSSPTVRKATKKRNFNRPKNLKTLPISRRNDKNHEKYRNTRNSFISNDKYGNRASSSGNKYKRKTSNFDMNKFTPSKKTTANDRIRFFDIYDNDGTTPYAIAENEVDKMINSNEIRNDEKIYLHHIDHGIEHDNINNTRYVKKHVHQNIDAYKAYTENFDDPTTTNNKVLRPIATTNQSPLSLWSEYPFVAVYIYEPTQVHCDSASISPHWLVASATCLNRHHRDIKPEGRSAFVAYCGGNWRHPERIAYVKQSLLHPRFHPKDNSRRQLYNIGAIQVVNSMADTCSGWAPVSLMSHQFVAASSGTPATALGWGLDRYDSRHSSSLPKRFTAYEGLVYSVSCPEINGYSTPTRLDEGSFRNVYCLSLAPNSEENVSQQGSLLLIGGKLIALYMQEERRSWSDRFIQYTGVWRLIPWLLEVAREPEQFIFEM